MDRVRFGIVVGGSSAEHWLTALSECAEAELAVVTDRDTERGGRLAERFGATFEDDERMAVSRHECDAVILAQSPAGVAKYIPTLADRGLAMVMESSPARSLEEAVGFQKICAASNAPILVSSAWRFDASLQMVTKADSIVGSVAECVGRVCSALPNPLDWRGDRLRAGAGVLMSTAYEWLDLLVAAVGLPADVFATVARHGNSGGSPYDVDDTAALIMRFQGDAIATVTARWGPPPHGGSLLIAGRDCSVRVDDKSIEVSGRIVSDETVADDDGAAIAASPSQILRENHDARRPVLEEMIGLIRSRSVVSVASSPNGQLPITRSQLNDHLSVLALLDAAYLSSRTGEPENVHQVFERAGMSVPKRRVVGDESE